jgi:deoxyribose-phosphate aldolase
MELLESILRDPSKIAGCIEHTNVRIDSSRQDIKRLCEEALAHGFYGVAVLPYHARLAKQLLGDRGKVVTVIGFPYGIERSQAKLAELRGVYDWVDEFDVVMNRLAFLNGDYEFVLEDMKRVVKAARPKPVKIIIEAPTLSDEQIIDASKLVLRSGAEFVKTAIGYAGPTTPRHVELIKRAVGELGIKASGGIRSFQQALEMVKAGATRIGTSSGVELMEHENQNLFSFPSLNRWNSRG